MDKIARFRYPVTSGTVFQATLAQAEWDRRPRVIGGHREAAVQTVQAGRTISRIYLLDIILRVRESEITAVENMVAWMQDNLHSAFDFWPDYTTTPGLTFTALLKSPLPGQADLEFARSSFPGMREVPLTLARSTGESWDLEYYGDF
jgi:hypothetical protein